MVGCCVVWLVVVLCSWLLCYAVWLVKKCDSGLVTWCLLRGAPIKTKLTPNNGIILSANNTI